LLSEYPPP